MVLESSGRLRVRDVEHLPMFVWPATGWLPPRRRRAFLFASILCGAVGACLAVLCIAATARGAIHGALLLGAFAVGSISLSALHANVCIVRPKTFRLPDTVGDAGSSDRGLRTEYRQPLFIWMFVLFALVTGWGLSVALALKAGGHPLPASRGNGPFQELYYTVATVVMVALLGALVVGIVRRQRITLTPAGIVQRFSLSERFTPWSAIASVQAVLYPPVNNLIMLTLHHDQHTTRTWVPILGGRTQKLRGDKVNILARNMTTDPALWLHLVEMAVTDPDIRNGLASGETMSELLAAGEGCRGGD